MEDVSIFSQWTYHYSSQFQSVSGSDTADLKNNLTQTLPSEFSDPTEIGGILIPFSPSGPTTIVHNSSQYLVLIQLISKIISHKPSPLSFLILPK